MGALIDSGIESAEDAQPAPRRAAGRVYTDEEAWDVLDDIPNGSSAALLLIEHRWAVPLRDAIARAGGFRISDGFISPLDLIEIGLVSPEEAEALLDAIKGATAPTSQNLRPGGDFGRQATGMSLSRQSEIASEDRSDRGSPPEDCHRNLGETDKCSMTRRASAAWKPPTTLVLVPAGTTSAARAIASWRAWPS